MGVPAVISGLKISLKNPPIFAPVKIYLPKEGYPIPTLYHFSIPNGPLFKLPPRNR